MLRYRWLFVKGDVFIGEWVHLVGRFSFVIANFSLNATSLWAELSVYCKLKGKMGETLEVDFGINHETFKLYYLGMYDSVHAEMVYTTRYDENSDLSTTYLGQTKMTRETRIKAKEKFPIFGQGFTLGKLLDGTEY